MQTPAVNKSQEVPNTNNVANEVPLTTAAPATDASTLTSVNPTQEKGFFRAISEPVVGAFTWVKEKIVSFFSYIRSLFCGVSDAVKAAQLNKLTEMKALVEKTRVDFIRERDADTTRAKKAFKDFWTAAFSALPQDIQDALIKEDLRDLYSSKPDSEKVVQEQFNDPKIKEERIAFVRDMAAGHYVEVGQEAYYADEDRYVPSYLQHIAIQIGNDIKALSEE